MSRGQRWALEPRLQGLLQVAAVVEPAELLPAIAIGLAGQVGGGVSGWSVN